MSVIEAIVALAKVVTEGLAAKKASDVKKDDETKQAIDNAGKLPPPPQEA